MQNAQQPLRVALPPLPRDLLAPAEGLVTCSICLRVQRAAGWIAPEDVIRELRTYELREPIRLKAGLCDDCAAVIAKRRGESGAPELANVA